MNMETKITVADVCRSANMRLEERYDAARLRIARKQNQCTAEDLRTIMDAAVALNRVCPEGKG